MVVVVLVVVVVVLGGTVLVVVVLVVGMVVLVVVMLVAVVEVDGVAPFAASASDVVETGDGAVESDAQAASNTAARATAMVLKSRTTCMRVEQLGHGDRQTASGRKV